MAGTRFTPPLRFQYWQGQSLLARDFNARLESEDQLRRWHNRALHLAFGVSFGLEVTQATDRSLTLSCGLAYDCLGYELVIPSDRAVTPPGSGTPLYLSLRWTGAGADTVWLAEAALGAEPGVLLARLGGNGSLDTGFHAVKARALRRPRLGGGATPPGNTPWEKLMSEAGLPLGLQTRIDTSAAGFGTRPFYEVSLVWSRRNERFTAPYVSIRDATPTGLAVCLLLQGIGQESFEVAKDIRTISSSDWSSHAMAPFLADDVVARVLPRVSTAIRIEAAPTDGVVLTLAGNASGLGVGQGDAVALVNLPRSPSASAGVRAIRVTDASLYSVGTVVVRRASATAGSVTRISRIDDGLLFPRAEIAGMHVGDNLSILSEAGKVKSVSNKTVTLQASPTAFTQGATVVRLSTNVETEVPVTVDTVDGPNKKIKLSAAIPGLKHDDVLGVASNGAAVTGFVDILDTPTPQQFRERDVLAFGPHTAIVERIDGNTLRLDSPLAVPAGGQVAIADYGGRSTISAAPMNAQQIPILDPSQFTMGDLVALLKGMAPGAAAISRVGGVSGTTLQVVPGLTGATQGDVVAVVRISCVSQVTSTTPLKVADSSLFRVGDMVTKGAGPTIVCAEIGHIEADGSLVLRGANIAPAAGDELNVVFVDTVAGVAADPTGNSITLDRAGAARRGWYVARAERWIDATGPVTLEIFPDGTLPGDSIGFAALSPPQPTVRFASSVSVPSAALLFIQGPDETSGVQQQIIAVLSDVNANKQAHLDFFAAPAFRIRPEVLAITAALASTLTDDFAAYAQQQGLSVCWMGVEIPRREPRECPGLPTDPCACQEGTSS